MIEYYNNNMYVNQNQRYSSGNNYGTESIFLAYLWSIKGTEILYYRDFYM